MTLWPCLSNEKKNVNSSVLGLKKQKRERVLVCPVKTKSEEHTLQMNEASNDTLINTEHLTVGFFHIQGLSKWGPRLWEAGITIIIIILMKLAETELTTPQLSMLQVGGRWPRIPP